MVRTLGFRYCDSGSIPGQGIEILQAAQKKTQTTTKQNRTQTQTKNNPKTVSQAMICNVASFSGVPMKRSMGAVMDLSVCPKIHMLKS